jgi:protein gp37
MHPDWVRGLRDQCQAARVPFFFKGWGNWAPRKSVAQPNDLAANLALSSMPKRSRHYWGDVSTGETAMFSVGKRAAGSELDGRTWEEFPEVTA